MSQADPCEDAWVAARRVLERQAVDADALATLIESERLLAGRADDESWSRQAFVLGGVAACHQASDDGRAVEVALRLLDGVWPPDALAPRLHGARAAVTTSSVELDTRIPIAGRAIALGGRSEDDWCREAVVWLLIWLADSVGLTSSQRRRALLTRVIDEFGDVDGAIDQARAALAAPYYEGLELARKPGAAPRAAEAFRRAAAEGVDSAWLELAGVLAVQAGHEAEEERALRAAIDAETLERRTYASWQLGILLHYVCGDREGAREAFGLAGTGTGTWSTMALRELAVLAALDGDHAGRRALVAEFADRRFAELLPDAGTGLFPGLAALSRPLMSRPFIAVGAWRWRRRRRRHQRRAAR